MASAQPPTIGLVLNTHVSYCRKVMAGVGRYALQHGWRLAHQAATELEADGDLELWKKLSVQGLVVQIIGRTTLRLARLGVPAVNISTAFPRQADVPSVCSDNEALGRAAAEHLLLQPVSHFAYFGEPGRHFGRTRGDGYIAALRRAGRPCAQLVTTQPRQIAAWVSSLPKPVGIFASSDMAAARLFNICLAAGVEIRGRMAVVGVDNDTAVCEAIFPRLTSVAQQTERIGWEAATMLGNMMTATGRGRPCPRPTDILLPPQTVVVRESSVLQPVDAELAEALKLIRDNVGDIRSVDDLAQRLAVSRRTLERRFATVLDRSPLEEIRQARVAQARQLLAETNMSVRQVARQCGFNSPQRLAQVFAQLLGTTPTAYRRRLRRI